MALVELWLSPGLSTGWIEVWPDSFAVPPETPGWVRLALPSAMTVSEAMAWWSTQINTVSGGVGSWTIVAGQSRLTTDPARVRWSQTLADLLGYSWTESGETGQEEHFGDRAPLGFVECPAGHSLPMDVENPDTETFRGGRVVSRPFGRALEVTIELYLTPQQWATLEDTSLASGHGARRITGSNATAYGPGQLDGFLDVYPIGTPAVERESEDSWVRVEHRCSMRDPGADPPARANTRWGEQMAAVVYGYAPQYQLVVDGLPFAACEYVGEDMPLPSEAHTADNSLAVDRSARPGPVLDEEKYVSKAYDLTVVLLDTPAVRQAVRLVPERYTVLAAAVTAGDTVVEVLEEGLFEVGDTMHVGLEAMEVASVTGTTLGVTRGTYGRARAHPAGTPVTDTILAWPGRGVRLVQLLLDPCGRYVDETCVIWQGHVQATPAREGGAWRLPCRDQIRRLTDPLGVAASGQATWRLSDDPMLDVDPETTLSIRVLVNGTMNPIVNVRPFEANGSVRASWVRQRVVEVLDGAFGLIASTGTYKGVRWQITTVNGRRYYQLHISWEYTGTDPWRIVVAVGSNGPRGRPLIVEYGPPGDAGNGVFGAVAGEVDVPMRLWVAADVSGATLSLQLDNKAAAEIPTSGWVRLDGEGPPVWVEYVAVETDELDERLAILTLEQDISADLIARILSLERDGAPMQMSATIYWRDAGRVPDVLRRALASSGDGVNGTFDVLPRGQGLDLPHINEASFERAFDGAFELLEPQVAVEGGTSLTELFSGLLRLSRRGLISRRRADGSAVEIAAIDTSSSDSVPVTTITDAMLVAAQGRRPVRMRASYAAPTAIDVSLRRAPTGAGDQGEDSLILQEDQLYWTRARWGLTIYGISRGELKRPATAWARSWFTAWTRTIYEIDVPPWVDAQAGDEVTLDLHDSEAWDWVTREAELIGDHIVLGWQIDLKSGVQTLTVASKRPAAAGPLAPSIPIVAVNGTATSPTSIDVPRAYFDLLVRARGVSTWRLLAYLPGQDAGRAVYMLGAVTDTGTVCRLAVVSSPTNPTLTLTTNHLLTYPVESDCTAIQAAHVHMLDGTQWD